MAVPAEDAFEEGGGVGGEDAEEVFALLSGGEVRPSDVSGGAAVPGDPAAGGGQEGVAGFDGDGVAVISDEVGCESQDHRGLPFAGMTHLALVEGGIGFPRLGAEVPVGGEEQEEIRALPVALSQFEHGLASRNVVPAVAVEEDDPVETVGDEVLGEAGKQVEVGPRRCGQGSLEVEVMVRVAEPGQGGEQDLVGEGFADPSDDLAEQQAVREERQVVAVLFEGGDGDHDRRVAWERGNRRPGKIREVHMGCRFKIRDSCFKGDDARMRRCVVPGLST